MAFMIPENLRNNSALPASHRRVATGLAVGLDDAATVWYEPPFDAAGERPDFVVLDPSIGVVVVVVELEVSPPDAKAATETMGAGMMRPPSEPKKSRFEKLKMPPSEPTCR